jgi:TRAP-type mannitol/chloroaromatic compound transport system substrate-binding protein
MEDLDPDMRAILKYAVEAASTANTAKAMRRYSADLKWLQEEAGVTIHRTSTDILNGQIEAWDKLIPVLEEDPFMKKCLDSQRAWVEQVTYYELMNAPDYALAFDHYFPGKLKM